MGNCLWWCPVASAIQLRCGTNEVWGPTGPPRPGSGRAVHLFGKACVLLSAR